MLKISFQRVVHVCVEGGEEEAIAVFHDFSTFSMKSIFQQVLRSLPENMQAAFLAQLLFPSLAHQGGEDSWTPHEAQIFLETSQISRAVDFQNDFPKSILRCHSPY